METLFYFFPGAVISHIDRPISHKEWFWIKAAGVIFNLISILFLVFLFLLFFSIDVKISSVILLSVSTIGWLALFNLAPLFGLDGEDMLQIGLYDKKYLIIYLFLVIMSLTFWQFPRLVFLLLPIGY